VSAFEIKHWGADSAGMPLLSVQLTEIHIRERIQLFLKRNTRFLHYSNGWKKSRFVAIALHPRNPDWEDPLATGGKAWVLQFAGTEMGNWFRRSSGYSCRQEVPSPTSV
jgi:hypothetical protein